MYRMMIVEDDDQIAEGIRDALKKWGYEAAIIRDFSNVLHEIEEFDSKLVLMDISLPFFNGYYWCQKLREKSKIPVIFVSSRADSMDIVMAVNMGGDDYLVKPFSPEVLVAKVQALLRRAYDYEPETVNALRDVRYDEKSATLIKGETRVPLTRNENRILSLLLKEKGAIVSREKIMMALWDSDEFVDENTLTVNINRLRKTLAGVGLDEAIKTHVKQGYRLDV